MWPPDDELLAAFRRLVADPDTAGTFADLVIAPLTADLARVPLGQHPDDNSTAAADAVLGLLRDPTRFDPERKSLAGYLRMAARGDLLNLLDKERRRKRHEIPCDPVELAAHARNEEQEEWSALADAPEFRAVLAGLSEADRRVFELMWAGERRTAVYADAMRIADRPPEEQAAEVKRAKDRIGARFRRAAGGKR